jgi:hypothetical protein
MCRGHVLLDRQCVQAHTLNLSNAYTLKEHTADEHLVDRLNLRHDRPTPSVSTEHVSPNQHGHHIEHNYNGTVCALRRRARPGHAATGTCSLIAFFSLSERPLINYNCLCTACTRMSRVYAGSLPSLCASPIRFV